MNNQELLYLLAKGGIIGSGILLTILAVYIIIKTVDLVSNIRAYQWSMERVLEEISIKKVALILGLLIVLSAIMINYYRPIDLLDEQLSYSIMDIQVFDLNGDRLTYTEDMIGSEVSAEMINRMSRIDTSRSMSSGGIEIESLTFYINLSGRGDGGYDHSTVIISKDKAYRVTGMNNDFIYKFKSGNMELYDYMISHITNS